MGTTVGTTVASGEDFTTGGGTIDRRLDGRGRAQM